MSSENSYNTQHYRKKCVLSQGQENSVSAGQTGTKQGPKAEF